MATSPLFAAVPRIGIAQISAANALRTSAAAPEGTVFTPGANGSRVERVTIVGIGTTTAGMVRLFLVDNASNARLLDEVPVSAITPSASVAAFRSVKLSSDASQPYVLVPSGWSLRASTNNAETFMVLAEGADF